MNLTPGESTLSFHGAVIASITIVHAPVGTIKSRTVLMRVEESALAAMRLASPKTRGMPVYWCPTEDGAELWPTPVEPWEVNIRFRNGGSAGGERRPVQVAPIEAYTAAAIRAQEAQQRPTGPAVQISTFSLVGDE